MVFFFFSQSGHSKWATSNGCVLINPITSKDLRHELESLRYEEGRGEYKEPTINTQPEGQPESQGKNAKLS